MLKEIGAIIADNERLRHINKTLVEDIDITFELINFCLQMTIQKKERQNFVDNYNFHSNNKNTRHMAFNAKQRRDKGHSRIN